MAKRVHDLKANNNNIHGHLGMDLVLFFNFLLLNNKKKLIFSYIFGAQINLFASCHAMKS